MCTELPHRNVMINRSSGRKDAIHSYIHGFDDVTRVECRRYIASIHDRLAGLYHRHGSGSIGEGQHNACGRLSATEMCVYM